MSDVVVVRHNYCISKSPTRLVSSLRQVFKEWRHLFITEASAFQQCQRGPTIEDYHIIGSPDSNDHWKATKVPTSGLVSGRAGEWQDVQVPTLGTCGLFTQNRRRKAAPEHHWRCFFASGTGDVKGKGKQMRINLEIFADVDTSEWTGSTSRGPLCHTVFFVTTQLHNMRGKWRKIPERTFRISKEL